MMIEFRNVAHSYGKKDVFRNLNMMLRKNKLTCLLGGSGCGKTTVLRLIAGLEKPLSGEILISGKIVSESNRIIVQPHKRNIGFIFQDLALWPHFTVYKNIAFGLEERKSRNTKNKVFEMLDFFGIDELADKYPHQLSGGQKQLVAIARALVLNPEILLMDEPLANLDVKLKRKILNHIEKLKQDFNLTIIYVTHDHKEAFAVSDEIVVMNSGKIEAAGTAEEIKKSENEFVKYFLEF